MVSTSRIKWLHAATAHDEAIMLEEHRWEIECAIDQAKGKPEETWQRGVGLRTTDWIWRRAVADWQVRRWLRDGYRRPPPPPIQRRSLWPYLR